MSPIDSEDSDSKETEDEVSKSAEKSVKTDPDTDSTSNRTSSECHTFVRLAIDRKVLFP